MSENELEDEDEIHVRHKDFEENLEMQEALAPVVLENLLDFGMEEGQELRVEYFFYTDSSGKANALATELKKLGYYVWSGHSSYDKTQFLINGWTIKMSMDNETMSNWVNRMSTLGYAYDCRFDGWGTSEQMQDDLPEPEN
ncbi:MAG: ribonuclease E inhibitor RraB [Bacteroidetes bacterium]|nr:ribonuclease E inhibitor RraB [Bacteroidota bacterium]